MDETTDPQPEPAEGAGQDTVEPLATEQPRRLRRDEQGPVGGLATGVARFLMVEPIVIQIAFLALVPFSGAGVVLYLAGWLLIPPSSDPDPRPVAVTNSPPAVVGGAVGVVIGAAMLAEGVTVGFGVFIPIVMILLGVWVLNQRLDTPLAAQGLGGLQPPPPTSRSAWFGPATQAPPPAPGAPAPPPPTAWGGPTMPPAPPSAPGAVAASSPDPGPSTSRLSPTPGSPSPGTPPSAPGSTASGASAAPFAAGAPTAGTAGPAGSAPYSGAPLPPPGGLGGGVHWASTRPDPASASSPEDRRPVLSITLAATAVAVGAFLVLKNVAGLDIGADLVLGSILAVIGVGLIVSSFSGRAWRFYPLAVLIAALLFLAPVIDATVDGGIGSRQIEVSSSGRDLESRYALGMGELLLDLREVELTEETTIEVDVGMGYAEIRVPRDLPVEVVATSRAGYVEAFAAEDEGVGNRVNVFSAGDPEAGPTLIIEADVMFGYVEVSRG